MSRLGKKKKCFEISSLILHSNSKHFLIRLWHVMTINNDQLCGWTEKLQSTSPSQTCTKKKKKKGHGHCLMVCCPSDPLQLSESCQNHYLWEICLVNGWDVPKIAVPAAGIVSRMCPILHGNAQLQITPPTFQSWLNSAIKFWLIHHIHLTSHRPPLLLQAFWQLFAGKMLPKPAEPKINK